MFLHVVLFLVLIIHLVLSLFTSPIFPILDNPLSIIDLERLCVVSRTVQEVDESRGRDATDAQCSSGLLGRSKRDKHGGWRRTQEMCIRDRLIDGEEIVRFIKSMRISLLGHGGRQNAQSNS